MAQCIICNNSFDDDDHKCYVICGYGHTVCYACYLHMLNNNLKCHTCRQTLLPTPIMVRLNLNSPAEVKSSNEPLISQTIKDAQNKVIVIGLDVSGSMDELSGSSYESPKRIEMVVHMGKIMMAFCQKLGIYKYRVYTFSNRVTRLDINYSNANTVLERLRADGCTNIGEVLRTMFSENGSNACYFLFTDGQPTDDWKQAVSLYNNTQLHLTAFSKDVDMSLLCAVAGNPLHSISYVEDIRSIAAYMIPVFVVSLTNMKTVTLTPDEDACRKMFVEWLKHRVNMQISRTDINNIMRELEKYHQGNTNTYAYDLSRDVAGDSMHSRIEVGTLDPVKWHSFGKFYNICILQCHEFLEINNIFDVSLARYRTDQYNELYAFIEKVPDQVKFVAFIDKSKQEEASRIVSQATSYVVNNSYGSSGDDGCIGPDELVTVQRMGKECCVSMKDVKLTDSINGVKIKWIIQVHNLEHGNPITLYNGLSVNHPVKLGGSGQSPEWIPASQVPNVTTSIVPGDTILYDVVLEDQSVPFMYVNGQQAALVGYPVPGMIHPYWGTNAVINDMESKCPGGGIVDIYL